MSFLNQIESFGSKLAQEVLEKVPYGKIAQVLVFFPLLIPHFHDLLLHRAHCISGLVRFWAGVYWQFPAPPNYTKLAGVRIASFAEEHMAFS